MVNEKFFDGHVAPDLRVKEMHSGEDSRSGERNRSFELQLVNNGRKKGTRILILIAPNGCIQIRDPIGVLLKLQVCMEKDEYVTYALEGHPTGKVEPMASRPSKRT